MAIWEVTLQVYGPIAVDRPLRLNEPKGNRLQDPFYSDVRIKLSQNGVESTVTAFASTEKLAYKAALLFFGQMLDVLSFRINAPLFLALALDYRPTFSREYKVRRRISAQEWRDAFKESRLLALSEPVFLRALGWYRKGLYTEDPFDKFVAFWNAIENVTAKYHPPIPNDKPKGSKSQIWESFKSVWGDCKDWPLIQGQTQWIDENNTIRNEIVHGAKPINVEAVESVLEKLETIRDVAYRFLTDWRRQRLKPEVPSEMRALYGYDE